MAELDRIRPPYGVTPLIRPADRPGDRSGEQGKRREASERREDTVELTLEDDSLPAEAPPPTTDPAPDESLDIEA